MLILCTIFPPTPAVPMSSLNIACLEACLGNDWLAFGQRLSLLPNPVLGGLRQTQYHHCTSRVSLSLTTTRKLPKVSSPGQGGMVGTLVTAISSGD